MKKKILYLSLIQWNSIKQRPQFIAEELSKYYEVTVLAKTSYHDLSKNTTESEARIRKLFTLPFERFWIISFISNLVCRLQLYMLPRHYDIIWLTSPGQIKLLPDLKGKLLIYDCMDDQLEFTDNKAIQAAIRKDEALLYNKADIVFCSSHFLRDKLISRYGQKNIEVVNNAIKNDVKNTIGELPNSLKKWFSKDYFTITYIGTIAEWMDYELLKYVVAQNPHVLINLFGPVSYSEPLPEQIRYCGTIPHSDIFSVMNESDALIMPFMITELIKSVNPVKLYEYIGSGKPCLAPKYGESEQFGDYVYLYKDKEECLSIINKVADKEIGAKKSKAECLDYVKQNTWQSRVKQMITVLNK